MLLPFCQNSKIKIGKVKKSLYFEIRVESTKEHICDWFKLWMDLCDLGQGLSGGASGKAGDARDAGSVPGSGRSPGGGHGNSLQYSCLENPMDRGT